MQDTCFERTVQQRADADDDRLAAGDTARRAQPEGTQADKTSTDQDSTDQDSPDQDSPDQDSPDQDSPDQISAIAQGIAETLGEFDTDDSDAFDLGAVPLDGPDAPMQTLSMQTLTKQTLTKQTGSSGESSPRRRRRRRPRTDASSRRILMAMLVSALLALGMVGFAVSEGFIP